MPACARCRYVFDTLYSLKEIDGTEDMVCGACRSRARQCGYQQDREEARRRA